MRVLIWLVMMWLPGVALADGPRILVMGDSFLAAHINTGRSVGDVLARELGAEVSNRPVLAARIIYNLPLTGAMGLNIGQQYRRGPWDWIVLNGGGNDLWLGCGCGQCDRKMERLIRSDGRGGEIVKLVVKLRETGARVIYVGYLRSPGTGSPIEHCKDEGAELETRIARMARLVDGVDYLTSSDIVPFGDRSHHSWDMIHPSPKGSEAVGERIAQFIRQAGR